LPNESFVTGSREQKALDAYREELEQRYQAQEKYEDNEQKKYKA
jgi:hypothetical protein